ncbi:MAG: hypothetical protein V3V08_07460 [Nannocystaceae bacterium]
MGPADLLAVLSLASKYHRGGLPLARYKELLDAALAEVRREAFEEAARESKEILAALEQGYGSAQDVMDAIRALADQPPPDTGWRDRPPTPAEVEAHSEGVWVWLDESGSPWWTSLMVSSGVVYDDAHTPIPVAEYHPEAQRWRPVTRDLFPAPWPEPERDVECLCGNNVGAIYPLHSSGAD